MPNESPQTFEVDSEQRLDVFLAQVLGLSRREVWRVLESSLINSDGRRLSLKNKGEQLSAGSTLTVQAFEHLDKILANEELELPILQTGEGFVVVNKPAGMPVRPKSYDETGTVLNALAAHYPKLQGVGEGGLKSGVVHRLDTDTSGVLVVATQQDTWENLRKAFSEHRTEKRYLALVEGVVGDGGRLELPLKVTRHAPAKVSVAEDGRLCTLSWKRLEKLRDASLVEVRLETGFLHQIRVMFAHSGHPVLGDKVYGDAAEYAERHMLHAATLRCKPIQATAEQPEDFKQAINLL